MITQAIGDVVGEGRAFRAEEERARQEAEEKARTRGRGARPSARPRSRPRKEAEERAAERGRADAGRRGPRPRQAAEAQAADAAADGAELARRSRRRRGRRAGRRRAAERPTPGRSTAGAGAEPPADAAGADRAARPRDEHEESTPAPAETAHEHHRQGRQGPARPHRRGDDGLQEGPQETGGDVDKAIEWLRVKGVAGAAKLGGREATEGTVQSYIHANGKIGVLVEVDCNTDFVARNEDFIAFARDVALHVAAAGAALRDRGRVPEDVARPSCASTRSRPPTSPRTSAPKIAEGKLEKWLEDVVLLNQAHVNMDKYEGKTIEQIRAELAAKTGENVVIRRFTRFSVGE